MIEIEPDPKLKKRFPAIGRMFITSVAEARIKYPRDPSKPSHKPDCTREAYEQAFYEGLQAAKDGKRREDCPYNTATDRRADAWLAGWEPSSIPLDPDYSESLTAN